MGRGLVEPVDDMRDTNPATNDALLNALVKDFVAHNYDVNYLIRTIMQSATYQTSSVPLKENADDDKYGSHYVIKRLPAEVMLDAYSEVTQSPGEIRRICRGDARAAVAGYRGHFLLPDRLWPAGAAANQRERTDLSAHHHPGSPHHQRRNPEQ